MTRPPDPAPAARLRARVFFAIWPAAVIARRLHKEGERAHGLTGGRRMRRDTLHLTLAFIGDIPRERLDALRAAADKVAFAPFTFRVDRIARWRHNHIVWAGASGLPEELESLVTQLNSALADGGFPVERRNFAAHVTLLRNARGELPAAELAPPIEWPVGEFVLVESDPRPEGAQYRVLQSWPGVFGSQS
ncbi:RNA 2',3'-cyclic phosphodiesterase [Aromatoleum toluclasticum]|uniref:RNA 2',3'-cyclic phosphodiesterase n=1 Tax=Aromatoleum toluclasticum TaxID=92003 RepID=UPI001D17F24C|nr:RNA 2',3'-cyclic phosphodiesterase [Aromatoleum toluclasticum]MCC4116028.1 RNA 2',3'-cyclic phosphodiesterase [Aromatoleum toluclasticum]